MSEFFEKYSAPFDAELRKQVDLLWPREVECLEGHGLLEANSILDLGTGNGYFLSRLAERHPKKNFTGIESSPSLAGMARAWKFPNIKVLEGSCPLARIEGRFDLVLARLSLYCMPNRKEVLRWARGLLNEGGRIAIMDVDDDLKTCWPPSELWTPIVAAMTKEIGPNADRRVGRKLPHLLLEAGFRDVKLELRPWYSSVDLGGKAFAEFWSGTARQMAEARPDVFGAGGLEKCLASIAEIAASPDKVALSLTCIASAKK